jgi:hypothetical protein
LARSNGWKATGRLLVPRPRALTGAVRC